MTTGAQWTFLPDRASWFLWTPSGRPDVSTTCVDDDSTPARMRLAIPVNEHVRAREVDGIEVGLRDGWEWLSTREPADGDSGSLGAWTRLARQPTGAAALPVAAHCAVTPDGAHIYTAAATVGHLRAALSLQDQLTNAGVVATLRGYQLAGLFWLTERDGGAILADDMGLGKTVQALALMALRPDLPHVVVCPTSVTENWVREAARHTPHLRLTRGRAEPSAGTVTVISYARLRRDPDAFSDQHWGVAVFDEAQQVKNPRTQAYRAARELKAAYRLVMTGTPVENQLTDLWALGDLAQPGILGTRRRFRDRFVVPIQRRASTTAAARLAEQTRELVLRRTKQDVAPELPAREVIDVACPISDEQRFLYQQAVDNAFGTGLGVGAARRTTILALLTWLKQICNHPAQALRQDGPLDDRSGKFDRLQEMLDETIAAGTGCLVFSQYTGMGHLLTADLAARHRLDVPFLHGGQTARTRDRIVERFQSGLGPNVLVLSLRAAGFGLNLTRATTVIHYDRWWNPAVEDQASDRAHRIGQESPVTIYTLRTAGTVEDHIAVLHQRKRGLVDAALTGGEAELIALPDEELYDILRLDPEINR